MTVFHARFGAALFALALSAGAPTTAAMAQPYPNRPVTIMLPLAAGSGMDTIARLYGEQLAQSLGRPIVVENRPGASLMLAAAAVATAPPDGYTLLVSTAAPLAINPTLYKQINYNAEKDFEPISLYVKSPFVLVVDPALPVKTVPELIKYIKESGKQLTYSSPGAGLAQHLSMEFMKQKFGLEITHVPYRNTPQSISDITAGHVNMGFAETGASLPLIKDGTLRAPAGTPKDIIDRLHQDMKKIMAAPEMKQKITDLGLIPLDPPSLPDTLAYVASERTKWSALVRKLGLEGTQ